MAQPRMVHIAIGGLELPLLMSAVKMSCRALQPINKSIFPGWSKLGSAKDRSFRWEYLLTTVAPCRGRLQVTLGTTAAVSDSTG